MRDPNQEHLKLKLAPHLPQSSFTFPHPTPLSHTAILFGDEKKSISCFKVCRQSWLHTVSPGQWNGIKTFQNKTIFYWSQVVVFIKFR